MGAIMIDVLLGHLRSSAERILEGAAFLFTDELQPMDIPSPHQEWGQVGVRLEFHGPHSGELRMWLPLSLSRMVAVNMLGLDDSEDCSEEKELDAVKEILNMILGNYLTDAYGVQDVYQLGIPRVLHPDEFAPTLDYPHLWLSVEGQPFLLALYGDS